MIIYFKKVKNESTASARMTSSRFNLSQQSAIANRKEKETSNYSNGETPYCMPFGGSGDSTNQIYCWPKDYDVE